MNTRHTALARELGSSRTRMTVARWLALGVALASAPGALGGPQPVATAEQPGVVRRTEPEAPTPPEARPVVGANIPLAPPDPAEALRAFMLVRGWLNEWTVGTPAAPPVAAVCVTLRLDGQVVGRAKAIAAEGSGGRGVIEEAVTAAMAQAEERLPIARDSLWESTIRGAGRSMRLSLEMGGLAVPVEVESFEQAALMVSPGVSGVGARVGTGAGARVSLLFPSAILSSGMDAGAALASAASDALGEADAALSGAASLQQRGVRFLAFQSVWVAEVGDDRVASILSRGGRVFETRDVSTAMLRELGGRMAGVLMAPGSGEGGASMGRAMTAYALARWAETPASGTDEQRADWAGRAREMFADAGAGMETASPAAAALWVMVGTALGPTPAGTARAEALGVARGKAGEVLVRAMGAADGLSPPVAAMVAWAAAARGGALRDRDLVDRAEAALRGAYARTPAGEWVGLMPWAGWAEEAIAAWPKSVGDGAMAGAAALREVRDLVWKHQIAATDVEGAGGADRDLVGGIVFTRGRQPLPTWHSLRPLAYLATMMGDARLTPEAEFPGQVLRMLTSLRFLRQLCVDESVGTWADGPVWGVRAATWTDDQPEDATALGLLVISESLRSLEAVAQRRAAVQAPAAPAPAARP